jgi:hypothetical protein
MYEKELEEREGIERVEERERERGGQDSYKLNPSFRAVRPYT